MRTGRLFVLEHSGDRIHSMNPDGSDRRTIVTACDHPDGIVVDVEDGHIYWTFTRTVDAPEFTPYAHYYGGNVVPDPREQAKGWLTAIDSTTGAVRWKKQWPTPLVAAVTATSGGVLFTGDLDNNFVVLDAESGETLYRFNTGGTIGGGVVTYELDGKQYVATTSGVVSGFFGGHGTSAIVVFALD